MGVLPACIYAHKCTTLVKCPQRLKQGINSPGSIVAGGCKPPIKVRY